MSNNPYSIIPSLTFFPLPICDYDCCLFVRILTTHCVAFFRNRMRLWTVDIQQTLLYYEMFLSRFVLLPIDLKISTTDAGHGSPCNFQIWLIRRYFTIRGNICLERHSTTSIRWMCTVRSWWFRFLFNTLKTGEVYVVGGWVCWKQLIYILIFISQQFHVIQMWQYQQ